MQQIILKNYREKIDTFWVRIFLSNSGKIKKIWLKDLGNHIDFGTASKTSTLSGKKTDNEWDLEEIDEKDLRIVFEDLALGNPEDFKALYQILKEDNSPLYPCIKSVLEKIQNTFNFD